MEGIGGVGGVEAADGVDGVLRAGRRAPADCWLTSFQRQPAALARASLRKVGEKMWFQMMEKASLIGVVMEEVVGAHGAVVVGGGDRHPVDGEGA